MRQDVIVMSNFDLRMVVIYDNVLVYAIWIHFASGLSGVLAIASAEGRSSLDLVYRFIDLSIFGQFLRGKTGGNLMRL